MEGNTMIPELLPDDVRLEQLENEADSIKKRLKDIKEEIEEIDRRKVRVSKYDGKYIVYDDGINAPQYMLVRNIRRDRETYTDHRFSYQVSGIGFSGEDTGYDDSTWFNFDLNDVFYIYGDTVQEVARKVAKITEITRDLFIGAFKEKMYDISEEFNEKMEKLP